MELVFSDSLDKILSVLNVFAYHMRLLASISMTTHHILGLLFMGGLLLLMTGCRFSSPVDVEPGVSWKLAEQRAQVLSEVRYDLTFTIPSAVAEPIQGQETITFTSNDDSQPLILDFNQPREHVLSVQSGTQELDFEVTNGHLVIPNAVRRVGENSVSITFLAGDGALNRETHYLYTLSVPDRASLTFPCLNQPNLKARYRLTLDVPAAWQAVANGSMQSRETNGARTIFQFTETKPISTYLFSFVAGDFKVETADRGGRQMNLFHRETDSEKVARNLQAVFDLHGRALEWLEDYTGIQYPFDKFDFVLVPSFQFNGMEHPGAILYRASSLLLDESATQNQKLNRASLIAHETAHMWFGDLVTMNWFDDVWTKEVFANFMAAKIVNPAFPEMNHDLRFFLTHYPAAYEVDRTEGANPIRQPLENLNEAGSLYGAIIYQKAPIVMRQLEGLMGEATFRDGLREYLSRFQFGNATWSDLIEILDRRTSEDLRAWSQVWLEEAGRPKITPYLALNSDDTISSLALRQTGPLNRGRLWNQRLEVVLGHSGTVRTFPIQLAGDSVTIEDAAGRPRPDFILAGGKGLGYGLFELDPLSREFLLNRLPTIKDEFARAVAWVSLWDAMLEAQIPPRTLMDLAVKALPDETAELNVQRITEYLVNAYWQFIPDTERIQLAPRLEKVLWKQIEKTSTTSLKSTYFRAFSSVVRTGDGVTKLERIWRKDVSIPGLPFSEQDDMRMALELAVREVPGWSDIFDEQLKRIEDPERKARFEFVMPALSADPHVREAFFQSLADPQNRHHEPWVLEALSYLHHPLRAASSESVIRPSLDLLEEIQRTGDIFFPKAWLDATLGGRRSARAAAIVKQFLAAHPNYPPRLRGKILQSADGLFRAANMSQ